MFCLGGKLRIKNSFLLFTGATSVLGFTLGLYPFVGFVPPLYVLAFVTGACYSLCMTGK